MSHVERRRCAREVRERPRANQSGAGQLQARREVLQDLARVCGESAGQGSVGQSGQRLWELGTGGVCTRLLPQGD